MESIRRTSNWSWIIAVLMFITAIVPIRSLVSQRALFEFFFMCAIVVILAMFIYENINKWVGAFLMVALISHALPVFLMTGKLNTIQSHLVLMNIVAGSVFYCVIVLSCATTDRIMDGMCFLALLHLIAIVFLTGKTWVGIMANPNEAAAFMTICAPAFLRSRWIYFIPIPIAGLCLTRSFGGMLGFCLVIIFYLAMKGHKYWPSFVMFAGAVLYYHVVDKPTVGLRWDAWRQSIQLSLLNLWPLGFGLGRWKELYPNLAAIQAMPEGFIRLHNTFLQNYIEMGIASIGVTAGYFINLSRRITHFKRPAVPVAAIAGITGCCMTNSLFRMNAINAMFALAWMAILEIELRK